jgi:hypothetical protein
VVRQLIAVRTLVACRTRNPLTACRSLFPPPPPRRATTTTCTQPATVLSRRGRAQAYVKDGAVCDKIMYGLLREERAALPPATHITVDGVTWVERPLTSSPCTAVSPQTGRLAPGNDAHAAVGGGASSGCAVSAPAAASAFE